MDAITFVNTYDFMVTRIEAICKPELLPAIKVMRDIDPHDLIQPDSYMVGYAGMGYVFSLFLNEAMKLNK